MKLLFRIDLALKHAGKTRTELAEHLDVSRQAISNLGRKEEASMKPQHIAKAARFMKCDVYWLCTGEGRRYEPQPLDERTFSEITVNVALWLEALDEAARYAMYGKIMELREREPAIRMRSTPITKRTTARKITAQRVSKHQRSR